MKYIIHVCYSDQSCESFTVRANNENEAKKFVMDKMKMQGKLTIVKIS